MALGIGANTAIFSFVDGVLLRPQPYDRPGEIVDVYQDSDDGAPNSNSFPAYRDIKSAQTVFSDAVAIMPFGVTLLEDDGAKALATEWVTSNYLSMLGLSPYLGRDFEPADQLDGGEPVAILSYATWQGRFKQCTPQTAPKGESVRSYTMDTGGFYYCHRRKYFFHSLLFGTKDYIYWRIH